MTEELKTLKDLIKENTKLYGENSLWWEQEIGKKKRFIFPERLKQEAIKIFKNLQGPDTIYPLILKRFPDSNKGKIAKDQWNDTKFRYGSEYGMLAMLFWLMNLTKEDLK